MREAVNMTQAEFAQSIGKNKYWARDIEQGKINYYFKDLMKLAKKFGFQIEITKK